MNDYPLPGKPVLEQATQRFADTYGLPPVMAGMEPAEVRRSTACLQDQSLPQGDEDTYGQWVPGPLSPHGRVPVRIVRPAGTQGEVLPVIIYLRGLGWALGGAGSHDRIVRSLALGADAAVIVPDFGHLPEARYPTALERCYAAACWTAQEASGLGVDASRIAIAGDSSGANLAAALTLLAKERAGVRFCYQVLFCPLTDGDCDSPSYRDFSTGYFIRADTMRWFWDLYAPERGQRAEITASPLRATTEQLRDLPPALVVTGEADVARDEGEAYAAKLRAADVPVISARYHGTIHDFMVFDALRGTHASKAALIQAMDLLHVALH